MHLSAGTANGWCVSGILEAHVKPTIGLPQNSCGFGDGGNSPRLNLLMFTDS
jgi:hypothetical protein